MNDKNPFSIGRVGFLNQQFDSEDICQDDVSAKCSLVCLVNMALPEHPGQGGLWGNHFIITHPDQKVSARQASTAQTLCAQVPAAHLGTPGLCKHLFISETQSFWSFLSNVF